MVCPRSPSSAVLGRPYRRWRGLDTGSLYVLGWGRGSAVRQVARLRWTRGPDRPIRFL